MTARTCEIIDIWKDFMHHPCLTNTRERAWRQIALLKATQSFLSLTQILRGINRKDFALHVKKGGIWLL